MRRVRAGGAASITAKLAALLLPLILIILLCFGQELNQLYRDMLAQEITQQVRLQLDSVADQIDSQLGEINRMSLFIYANEDLRTGFTRRSPSRRSSRRPTAFRCTATSSSRYFTSSAARASTC